MQQCYSLSLLQNPGGNARIDSLHQKAEEFIRIQPDSAFIILSVSIKEARQFGYDEGIAFGTFLLGNFYQNKGQLELAYRSFYESAQLNEKLGNKKRLAESHNSMGDVLRRQKNHREANINYEKAIALASEIGDSILISENINNFGDVFRDQRDYEKAIIHYQKALDIDIRIGNQFGITDGYNNLGDIYLYMGDPSEAISYYNKSLRIAESMNNQLEIADNLNKMGNAYAALGDKESSLFYSKLAATVSQRIGLTEELMEAYRNLTAVYKSMNRYDKALESHELYTRFQDTLLNIQSVRRVSELQYVYEAEKKDNELLLKEAELETRSLQLKWVATAGILMLILALVLYKNYITKQRVNRQLVVQQNEIQNQTQKLEEKNEMLRSLNDEKSEIIGMVAHDLRAPINQVISVVNLMQYEENGFSADMKKYVEILDKSSTRMKFMVSEILDAESIENSIFNLDLKPVDMTKVVTEELGNFQLYAEKKHLKLELEKQEGTFCARLDENVYKNILENLLSNAIKYSPEGKVIKLKIRSQNDKVVTSVKDEGPGLSVEDMGRVFGKFQRLSARPTGGEASIGLGLSLVKKFTEVMNGQVWCESKKGEGAEFFVSFERCN